MRNRFSLLAFIAVVLVLSATSCFASDYSDRIHAQNKARAAYWQERGYDFNPQYMSAYAMDRKVTDIERGKYWKERGYDFDSRYMTAYAMDRKVTDIERGKYWKERGYDFDSRYMTAYAMDREVEKRQRPTTSAPLGPVSTLSSPSSSPFPVPVITSSYPSTNPATFDASVAENGSYYGEPNKNGVPKTVHVNGYTRRDGTYVRGHYRSSPRR